MKLYVSLPSYTDVVETATVRCLMNCLSRALVEGLIDDYYVNFQGEALIHRCRNRHANHALKLQIYDRFLSIDSDIIFTWNDFKRLVGSSEPFIGGSYPLKAMPPVVNFNPMSGAGRELLKTNRGYDYDAFEKFKEKYVDETGLVEVTHLPTGFLCVSMEVFAKLSHTVKVYGTFAQESGQREGQYDFYPSAVHEGELESEDWGFCRLAKEAGYRIMFDTNVICGHIGKFVYRLGQVYGEINAPKSQDYS